MSDEYGRQRVMLYLRSVLHLEQEARLHSNVSLVEPRNQLVVMAITTFYDVSLVKIQLAMENIELTTDEDHALLLEYTKKHFNPSNYLIPMEMFTHFYALPTHLRSLILNGEFLKTCYVLRGAQALSPLLSATAQSRPSDAFRFKVNFCQSLYMLRGGGDVVTFLYRCQQDLLVAWRRHFLTFSSVTSVYQLTFAYWERILSPMLAGSVNTRQTDPAGGAAGGDEFSSVSDSIEKLSLTRN